MKWWMVSLSILLLLGLGEAALAFNPAQTELRYYAFVPDADMPTMDGVFSPGEWDFAPSDFVYKLRDWWGADRTASPCAEADIQPHDYSDFDVPFVFFGWNPGSNSIVWGLQVVDNVFYAPYPYFETFKSCDSIYWYMDADGDGGQYQYWDKTGADGQQGIFRYDETAEYPWHIGAYVPGMEGSWAFQPPYVYLGISLDPVTGSATVELSMQVFDWMENASTGGADKSIVHQFTAGEIIGARWTVYDGDSEAADDWADFTFNAPYNLETDNAYTSDDFTKWMVLSEEDTYGGGVAVESTSWGYVKALLK